jgi:glycoprotein 6-alpha-L-fucosyltransferase
VSVFSFQFCRVAYALMHKYHLDASNKVRSLDDVYFYAGHEIPKRVAIMDHKSMAPGEIDLVVGDRIQFAGNHWNGFSKVRH